MKKILKTAVLISAVVLGLEITSCSEIETGRTATISDISRSATYNKISQQGFMGGSVLYNPDDESLGQLAKDVTLAFRLGHVSKTPTKSDEFVYTDLPDEARFGTIHITAIDTDNITFTATLFSVDGISSRENSFSVSLNETADIDGDGLADVEYKMPARKRTGFKKAVYLNFLSSQETLNTSMFAVLPEQYAGGSYPNGILGINPDGKFIVRKYEDMANSARSVVAGTITGDYVLDTATGEYQRITSKGSRNARAIQDNELETVEDEISISYYFTEEDFCEDFSASALYNVLPTSVKKEEGSSVEKLNRILENRDLIPLIKSVREIPIDDDIYGEVISELATLSSEDLVQLNRIFLEETYPELCPQIITNSSTFTEILPLVSVKFGLSDNEIIDSEEVSECRAATGSEYTNQKRSIQNEFNTYKHLKTIGLDKRIRISCIEASLSDSYVSIGMRGNFSSSWGNLNTNLRGVALLQLSAKVKMESNLNANINLLNIEPCAISYPVFSCGPIILSVNGSMGINIPFNAGLSAVANISTETQLTGLYGCGFSIGLDYGVKWKKKWFVRYPRPYANWHSSGWSCNRTAYYIDPSVTGSVESVTGNMSIHPQVRLSVGADISKTVWGDFSLIPGLKTGLEFNYRDLGFDGTAYIDLTLGRRVNASVGLKGIPIINKLSYSKSWDLGTLNNRVASWKIHK